MSSDIAVSESAFESQSPVAEPSRRPGPPGPGLPESAGWALGFFFVQVFSALLCGLVLLAILGFIAGIRQESMPDFASLGGVEGPLTSIAASALSVLILIGLVWLRLGRFAPRKLNLSLPSLKQTIILSSMIVPLMLVSGTAYELVESALQWLIARNPSLAVLNLGNGVPYIEEEIAQLPLLLSLFSVAVLPALGEELLCRGLIGRGLVARWGIVRGVLLTSMLFGMLHLYPPHVASAFVLGVAVHVIYLATRSFWAPVLYHFLNNATVVVLASITMSGQQANQFADPSGWLVAVALAYVVIALAMLWRYRTVYRNEEGREVAADYPTVSAPRPDAVLVRTAPTSRLPLGFFSMMLALVVGGVAIDFVTSPDATDDDTRQTALTDREISKLLVGRWDSGTQFNADGTFVSEGAIDGEETPMVAAGTWDVSNGVLRATVTASKSPQIETGATLYWEVLSIDEATCEYRTGDGEPVREHRVVDSNDRSELTSA